MLFLFAFIAGLVSMFGVPYLPKHRKSFFLKGAAWRGVLGALLGAWMFYAAHPNFLAPWGWTSLLWFVAFAGAFRIVECFIAFDEGSGYGCKFGAAGAVLAALALSLIANGLVPWLSSQKTHDMFQTETAKEPLPSFDGKEMPIVPRSTALQLANGSLGDSGQQFEVIDIDLARYQGKLYWIGAMDYKSFMVWWNVDATPGYVMVSATDATETPKVVANSPLKYTENGYFWHDLDRIIDFKYPEYRIGNENLEIDTEGKPWWVVSLYEQRTGPELGESKPAGSVIVDPKTGETARYEIGKQPAWVSQVVGADYVQDAVTRWGGKVHGAINFGGKDEFKPVDAPIGVVGKDGKLYWYTGLSAQKGAGKALFGYVMTDAATGKSQFYDTSKLSLQNGDAAIGRVSGVAQNATLKAAEPVFYNLFGHPAFISPMVNANGILTQYAIVDPTNQEQPIVRDTLSEAVSKWQEYLATGGAKGEMSESKEARTVAGEIERIQQIVQKGESVWYFTVKGSDMRFSATMQSSSDMPFLREGDSVSVKFIKVSSPVNPASEVKAK